MANENNGPAFATLEAVAALAARITAIETQLAQKMPGFEQVGARVSELSAGFQAANSRLATLESTVAGMTEAPEVDVVALITRLDNIASRLAVVEQTRARGGRLSERLSSIETKLDSVLGAGGK